jgi:hypothetical protein
VIVGAAVAGCVAAVTAGCGGGKQAADGSAAGRPAGGAPPSVVTRTPGPDTPAPSDGGTGGTRGTGGRGGRGGTGGSTGGGADGGRVAYFSVAGPVATAVHEVLRDQAALERFARQAAAGDPATQQAITASGAATDYARDALVGWTATTGCSAAASARLDVTGDRLHLRISRPKAPPECLAPFHVTVVFEVPGKQLPAHPVFG